MINFNLKKRNINIIKINGIDYPVLECIKSPLYPRLITEICPFCNEIHYCWESEINKLFSTTHNRCGENVTIKTKNKKIVKNENGYVLKLSDGINVTLYKD